MKFGYTIFALVWLPATTTAFSPVGISSRTTSAATTSKTINNNDALMTTWNFDWTLNAETNGVNGLEEKKKVIVLGGDGFCGWPTSLYLSDRGHDVIIVDNLSRRKIDLDLGCDSLTPIASPETRVQAWKEVSGKEIKFINLDVAKEYDLLVQLIKDEQPDSIVHFAEQRAAPYSMKNSKTKRYTSTTMLAAQTICAVPSLMPKLMLILSI
jgi:hypothetical protein